jgi:hypothetical protein
MRYAKTPSIMSLKQDEDLQFQEPKLLKDGSLSPIQFIPFLNRKIDLEAISTISHATLTKEYTEYGDYEERSPKIGFDITFRSDVSSNGFVLSTLYRLSKNEDFIDEDCAILQEKIDVLTDWWEKVKTREP